MGCDTSSFSNAYDGVINQIQRINTERENTAEKDIRKIDVGELLDNLWDDLKGKNNSKEKRTGCVIDLGAVTIEEIIAGKKVDGLIAILKKIPGLKGLVKEGLSEEGLKEILGILNERINNGSIPFEYIKDLLVLNKYTRNSIDDLYRDISATV